MLLNNTEVSEAQMRQQREKSERFAAPTAEAIGTARNCLFSVLPYEERFRQAASWYEACTQAMLRGNYAPLDDWIRTQACMAAEENFELEDLLHLLRICRRSAIEVDRWDQDTFYHIDEIINEGILAIRAKVPWNIPDSLNYLKETECAVEPKVDLNASKSSSRADTRDDRQRVSGRNRVALPIRVLAHTAQGEREEITQTKNVSLGGLYFNTQKMYREGAFLRVIYPYWTGPGSINKEYSARVVRVDPLPDHVTWGVAVEFLQNLHQKLL